jgi:hypothetical protein
LRIGAIRASYSGVVLEFSTVPGRSYTIECCPDLARGEWIPIRANIPGTGDPLQFLDPAATRSGPQCFYRLRVKLP